MPTDHSPIALRACAVEARAGELGLSLQVEDGAMLYRIDVPDFVVLQMLRTVHLRDASVLDGDVQVHPVAEWRVARLDEHGSAAVQLTDVRGVGGAFAFDLEELQAIHQVMGDLIERQAMARSGLRLN